MVHLHAVVDPVPERREHERQRAHHRMRIVGGDFPRDRVRLAPGVLDRLVVATRLFGDGLLHSLGRQHLVHQQATVRQVRPDHRCADAREVHAQHARELAHGAFGRKLFGDRRAQWHRRGELHDRIAPIEQHREQAAEATNEFPIFREQHREPARLPVRRTTDEDRHRHHLDIQVRMRALVVEQLLQAFGMGARARPSEPRATTARQGDVGALVAERVAGQRGQRRGQSRFAAGAFQDQRIRQPIAFEHIAQRSRVCGQLRHIIGRLDPQADPWRKQLAQQQRPQRGVARGRQYGSGGLRHHRDSGGANGRAAEGIGELSWTAARQRWTHCSPARPCFPMGPATRPVRSSWTKHSPQAARRERPRSQRGLRPAWPACP